MFVGETGIGRIIRRTLEEMVKLGTDDPAVLRRNGVIDLPLLQRYINFWYSSALDLFGSEISSNAANYFANGLKGRPDEETYQDHDASNTVAQLDTPRGIEEVPSRKTMNYVTRSAYIRDCRMGLTRWNRVIAKSGFQFELMLPSERFNRRVGLWAGLVFGVAGQATSPHAVDAALPTESDRAYIRSLMVAVNEIGKIANWIAPPERGINNQGFDYDYVRAV
jgi:benzoyl-CoA 2,3-epoxidase subunit B